MVPAVSGADPHRSFLQLSDLCRIRSQHRSDWRRRRPRAGDARHARGHRARRRAGDDARRGIRLPPARDRHQPDLAAPRDLRRVPGGGRRVDSIRVNAPVHRAPRPLCRGGRPRAARPRRVRSRRRRDGSAARHRQRTCAHPRRHRRLRRCSAFLDALSRSPRRAPQRRSRRPSASSPDGRDRGRARPSS